MKLYGLFKVINKNKKDLKIDLYNLLHANKKLNDISLFDIEPKTYLNFFYEDNPVILKAGTDIQYVEYIKFKKELEGMISKQHVSQYERDMINKMLLKVIIAENKFIKYKNEVSKINELENENDKIINDLENSQSKFAKNIDKYLELYYNYADLENDIPEDLKLLFDIDQIEIGKYEDTIMYRNSIISFYRTGVKYNKEKIILDNDRVEYVVFEPESNESIELFNYKDNEIINKVKTIKKLYEEIDMPVPKKILSKLDNKCHYIEFEYNGKTLIICPIGKDEKEIFYEIKT